MKYKKIIIAVIIVLAVVGIGSCAYDYNMQEWAPGDTVKDTITVGI